MSWTLLIQILILLIAVGAIVDQWITQLGRSRYVCERLRREGDNE